jgi:hypothetical protein
MTNRQKMADRRVDAFVTAVNASPKVELSCDSIPELCRLTTPKFSTTGSSRVI